MGREPLLALGSAGRREDLVLMGDVGTGKAHTASALCAPACERRLNREAAPIGRAHLPVVGWLGPLPLDADGATPPFQVFADACEGWSVVVATNLESGRWGSVFGDDQTAAAVIDRIARHGGARPVPRRVLPRSPCPHAEGLAAKMRVRFRCSGCSIYDALFAQILLTEHTPGRPYGSAR